MWRADFFSFYEDLSKDNFSFFFEYSIFPIIEFLLRITFALMVFLVTYATAHEHGVPVTQSVVHKYIQTNMF